MLREHIGAELRNDIVRENKVVCSIVDVRGAFGFDQVQFRMVFPKRLKHARAKINTPVETRREAQIVKKPPIAAADFEDANRITALKEQP